MYIQSYFKNGNVKKSVNKIKSVEKLMDMFEQMNGGKTIPINEVRNNFSKRDLIRDDGTSINLWSVMVDYGFVRD